MSPSPCGFWPTTGIRYNIAYKTSDQNPNNNKVYVFHELHTFGQHVIIHNPDSSKIEPRDLPGQYLGPDPFSPGHRIWINGKISIECSVQFLESTHPRIEGEKHKCHDIKCNTQSSGNMPDTEHEIVPQEQ